MSIKYSKEEGLKLLKENIEKLGHIPTSRESTKLKLTPNYSWYKEHFGSFSNALKLIGYNNMTKTDACNLTREDLVMTLKDLSKRLGRTPTSTEIKNPSIIVYYNRFGTQSWNKILKEVGLQPNHEEYDKNTILKGFINFYNELGRVPTQREINNNKDLPHSDWIYANYKTINDLYYNLGIIDKPLTKQDKINITIEELKKLADKLGRCPTVPEFDALKHDGISRRRLEVNLGIKYNDICRKYISKYELNNNLDITKEDVINSINKMNKEFGYMLPFDEYKILPYSYSYGLIDRLFGLTYGQLIESLGYKTYGTTTLSRNTEEMLEDFMVLFKKLNRVPLYNEMVYENNICTYGTYIRRFGNIKNVCDLLNIDWKLYNQRKSGGKILFDKNNEMCRSVAELEITNWFIDNNVKYRKEVSYSEILDKENNRKQVRRFDWVIEINNIKYYLEYCGMYFPNYKSKISKEYVKRTRKKIRDLYKAGIIDKCVFILPKDIKDNTIGGLQRKLESFFMQKFNININKVA